MYATFAFAGINVNSADQKTLETLSKIGAAKAKAIIAYRETNGPFKKIEDLTKVKGIGKKLLKEIKDEIVVE